MSMTPEQATWFAGTFEKLVANVGQAILGKSHVISLTLAAMLAEGHVLFEDAGPRPRPSRHCWKSWKNPG